MRREMCLSMLSVESYEIFAALCKIFLSVLLITLFAVNSYAGEIGLSEYDNDARTRIGNRLSDIRGDLTVALGDIANERLRLLNSEKEMEKIIEESGRDSEDVGIQTAHYNKLKGEFFSNSIKKLNTLLPVLTQTTKRNYVDVLAYFKKPKKFSRFIKSYWKDQKSDGLSMLHLYLRGKAARSRIRDLRDELILGQSAHISDAIKGILDDYGPVTGIKKDNKAVTVSQLLAEFSNKDEVNPLSRKKSGRSGDLDDYLN